MDKNVPGAQLALLRTCEKNFMCFRHLYVASELALKSESPRRVFASYRTAASPNTPENSFI